MFSENTNKLLLQLRKTALDKDVFDPVVLNRLFSDGYIRYTKSVYSCKTICLTEQGKGYAEAMAYNHTKELISDIHKWVNTAIALAALFVALFD